MYAGKPQANDDKKKIAVWAVFIKITVNNIVHRPPLTKVRGRCVRKFKLRRTNVPTKAAMVTVFTMKNVLRAPGKKKKTSLPGCARTNGWQTLTYKLLH